VDNFVEKLNIHSLTYGATKTFSHLINNLTVVLCYIYHVVSGVSNLCKK